MVRPAVWAYWEFGGGSLCTVQDRPRGQTFDRCTLPLYGSVPCASVGVCKRRPQLRMQRLCAACCSVLPSTPNTCHANHALCGARQGYGHRGYPIVSLWLDRRTESDAPPVDRHRGAAHRRRRCLRAAQARARCIRQRRRRRRAGGRKRCGGDRHGSGKASAAAQPHAAFGADDRGASRTAVARRRRVSCVRPHACPMRMWITRTPARTPGTYVCCCMPCLCLPTCMCVCARARALPTGARREFTRAGTHVRVRVCMQLHAFPCAPVSVYGSRLGVPASIMCMPVLHEVSSGLRPNGIKTP
jgi:hypothetical protein